LPSNLDATPGLSHAASIVMARMSLRIEGRVQGVGFRWYVASEARSLGLTGSVRNHSDGGVVLEACGPRPALERLLEAVRRGPPGARVTAVHDQWSEGDTGERGFEIAV
jgi:acylphosphatase